MNAISGSLRASGDLRNSDHLKPSTHLKSWSASNPASIRVAGERSARGEKTRANRAVHAFLDESGDLLRLIRESDDHSRRHRAARRLHWMALMVGASSVNLALADLCFVQSDALQPNAETVLASADLISEKHLERLARLHAAAAEARAAAAVIIAAEGPAVLRDGL